MFSQMQVPASVYYLEMNKKPRVSVNSGCCGFYFSRDSEGSTPRVRVWQMHASLQLSKVINSQIYSAYILPEARHWGYGRYSPSGSNTTIFQTLKKWGYVLMKSYALVYKRIWLLSFFLFYYVIKKLYLNIK